MTPYVTVPGTWSRRTVSDAWWHESSPWSAFMRQHGCCPAWPANPFMWSGDIDGSLWAQFVGLFTDGGTYSDWDAGGFALALYLQHLPVGARHVVSHSHGLQVALFCAARHVQLDSLISVCGPVRKDMTDIAIAARPWIGRWVHVHSDRSDRWQWFGEIGDGALGIVRPHPLADENVLVPNVGHSQLFTDPRTFHHWVDAGVIGSMQRAT